MQVIKTIREKFKSNVGLADRIFRFVLGVLFVLVFIYVDLPFITSLLVLAAGLLSIASGLLGFCFFYYYFKEDFTSKGKSNCGK
ncbi:MAG: DUF2892 domain-containing protein [Bacteroidia bacterium]|nr:DUF2892 domain-containing protein [Bacteroidia bacterium]